MRFAPATTPQRPPIRREPMFHRAFHIDTATIRTVLVALKLRFQTFVDEDALACLELALAEVLNNISEHGRAVQDASPAGPAPRVHLCVICRDGGLICAVTDNGRPLPPACLTPTKRIADNTASRDSLPEGGFGWPLIQRLTGSLSYLREGSRNFLSFTIPPTREAERRKSA